METNPKKQRQHFYRDYSSGQWSTSEFSNPARATRFFLPLKVLPARALDAPQLATSSVVRANLSSKRVYSRRLPPFDSTENRVATFSGVHGLPLRGFAPCSFNAAAIFRAPLPCSRSTQSTNAPPPAWVRG
jgi:hypothetical protein